MDLTGERRRDGAELAVLRRAEQDDGAVAGLRHERVLDVAGGRTRRAVVVDIPRHAADVAGSLDAGLRHLIRDPAVVRAEALRDADELLLRRDQADVPGVDLVG